MTKSGVDKLGDSLRTELTNENLQKLDEYRRSFFSFYSEVVEKIRELLKVEISGRPAKTTISICEKLYRSPIRLSQMADIAGCRIIVPDMIVQGESAYKINDSFNCKIVDRIKNPSYGYRAIHVIVKRGIFSVEVQIRTELQHLWAELSEKSVDLFGSEVKYGGGGKVIQDILDDFSYRVYEHDKMILAKLKGSSSKDYKLLELLELLDKDSIFEMKEELKDDIRCMISTIDDIKEKL